MLRCLKLWAKRRGVYGTVSAFVLLCNVYFHNIICMDSIFMAHLNQHFCLQLLGYLGGVHLAVLAAYVCQRHPDASLNALIMNFFRTFAFWPWPTPVMLQEGMLPAALDAIDPRSFMPIYLPSGPYEYCHSNITASTFYRIRAEFIRGHNVTKVCSVLLILSKTTWS